MIDESEPNLAAALGRVADTVSESLRAARQADARRWRISLGFLFLGGPVAVAVTVVLALQQGTIHTQERLIRKGISCLLADQDDHRITNKEAHRQLALAHGVTIQQHDEIPLDAAQATALKQQCISFVQEAIGQGLGSGAKEKP